MIGEKRKLLFLPWRMDITDRQRDRIRAVTSDKKEVTKAAIHCIGKVAYREENLLARIKFLLQTNTHIIK